ncbi:MAG: hypothetical protein SF066_10185 [Thermoanaerobaculia bacterium]|nr:hypothetical protein [Thermoanaerobaculia bacterium]
MNTLRIVPAVRVAIAAGWALSVVALFMVNNLNDSYRRGYEEMVRDASLLFCTGGVLVVIAGVAAWFVRRHDPLHLSKAWLWAAGLHVLGSAIIFGFVFALL